MITFRPSVSNHPVRFQGAPVSRRKFLLSVAGTTILAVSSRCKNSGGGASTSCLSQPNFSDSELQSAVERAFPDVNAKKYTQNIINNENFMAAVNFVLDAEGEKFNPADPSKWGIMLNSNGGLLNRLGIYNRSELKTLTKEEAILVYYRNYWQKIPENVNNPKLRIMYFDTAVNMGAGDANECFRNSGSVRSFASRRKSLYRTKPNYRLNGEGWINRVDRLVDYINQYC